MNCPSCQNDNPDAARFCMSCGTALRKTCANCGTELPTAARFCMSCGQPAVERSAADDVRLTRLAAAAPAPLAEKMRTARLSGERKVVTALFADVVNSTGLASQLDFEEWTGIMNGAFDRLAAAVYRYEGTIARLLGDALLAFFGAPVAHEDDPLRAVRAGLEMLAAARDYADQVRRQHGIDFAIRVGLNTGPVFVGEVGSDLKYEFTALGDAVNLASRIQSAARPGTLLVSDQTFRFVAPVVDSVDLGTIQVKGKLEPVHVHEVTALKAAPGRLRGGVAGMDSPLVGREAELAALRQLTDAARAGAGRAALIVGEPGLGKTRLVAEWRAADAASDRPLRWAEGRCLSYGQGLAYHLLVDLLRSLIGVTAAASEAETRAALKQQTSDLFGADDAEIYPYLGHLLNLQLDGDALERIRLLDPETLQTRYFDAFRQLIHRLAARAPLGLILDDIHWADPSSVALLGRLLPLSTRGPIVVCFATRPEPDAPGWRLVQSARETLGSGLIELPLERLSEDDSRRLVANLLDLEALPDRLRELILAKAEGNPFFVEEVIRMLIDRGAIVRDGDHWRVERHLADLDVPDNLQGLLLARIDRLPEDVKRTLRIASVIGRQFSVRVLDHVLRQQTGA